MKIKPEHYAILRELMTQGITRIPALKLYENRDASIPRIASAKDPSMRYRWDALYSVNGQMHRDVMLAVYDYANDTHIDTALRAIVKELTK